MNDMASLLFGSCVSFLIAAAIGLFGKRSLRSDLLLLIGIGVVVVLGYLLIFGDWSESMQADKLLAFLVLFIPGFTIYFFLPLIPGYMLGAYFKKPKQS